MSIKYTVEKNALRPGTFYPRPFAITTRKLDVLVRNIANATTVSEPDVEAAIRALRHEILTALIDGDRVSIDGLVDFRPRLSQVLQSGAAEFDPQSGGEVFVAATIKPALTEALRQQAGFEKVDKGTKIPLVKSLYNSATKSSGEYTPGRIGELAGSNLRLLDEQAPDQGIFFIAVADGSETRVADIHHNAARTLIFLIPQGLSGDQRVQVRTRFTDDGNLRIGELDGIVTPA